MYVNYVACYHCEPHVAMYVAICSYIVELVSDPSWLYT